MNIALTGAHGTGKTTLISEIVRRLGADGLSVHLVDEVPRKVCDAAGDPEFFRRGGNTLIKQSLLIVSQLAEEFVAANSEADIVLFDRNVLDHWVYTIHLGHRDAEFNRCRSAFENVLKSHMSHYDKVFLIRPEFPPIDDGVREGDVQFQSEIDELAFRTLEGWGVKYERISGSVSNRANAVMASLRGES